MRLIFIAWIHFENLHWVNEIHSLSAILKRKKGRYQERTLLASTAGGSEQLFIKAGQAVVLGFQVNIFVAHVT